MLGNDWQDNRKDNGKQIPTDCKVLYMCNFDKDNIQLPDRHLVKILLKAMARRWGKTESPTQDQWTELVEEIYIMQKICTVRLEEAQMSEKWMRYKKVNSNKWLRKKTSPTYVA